MSGAIRHLPRGRGAVMNSRIEPPESLDFFPTPPWGTRALLECVLSPEDYTGLDVLDPCAGQGHMAFVLEEYFARMYGIDVFDYGAGFDVGSYIGEGPDVARCPFDPDWAIFNPPFVTGEAFVLRALEQARRGVAMLARSNWSEGENRYEAIFRDRPPDIEAVFVERLPMHKGEWKPDGSTTTAYSWFVWRAPFGPKTTVKFWIPPGQRYRLEHPDDRRRFARKPEMEGMLL